MAFNLLGAIIPAAASLLGGVLSNKGSSARQADAQDFNAQQAQQNREFQDEMSRTAHQREVADLKEAGLNPILSGTGGAGASTPSGSMGSSPAIPYQDPITPAVSSAMDAQRTSATVDLLKAQALTETQKARLAGSQADMLKPASTMMGKAGDVVVNAIEAVPDLVAHPLPAIRNIADKFGIDTGRKMSKEEVKDLREGWDYQDAAKSLLRGLFDNSAKSADRKKTPVHVPMGKPNSNRRLDEPPRHIWRDPSSR